METRNRGQGTRGAPDAQVGTETAQTRASAWEALAASPEFRRLISAKRNFIIPAVIFFLVYYFALPLGNGLAPRLMNTNSVSVFSGSVTLWAGLSRKGRLTCASRTAKYTMRLPWTKPPWA